MDLHTGLPLWQAINPPPRRYAPAQGSLRCEVAVIGAGITGALVAHFFVKEGIDVVLIDREQPGQGSTAASTGLLQFEIDTPLCDLVRKVGAQRAVHAYQRGIRAIDELEQLMEGASLRCGFSRRESIYFASHWWHLRALKREAACRREHGLPVKLLSRRQLADISSIRSAGALLSPCDGQMDQYAFTQQLLAALAMQGVRIFGDSRAAAIEESSRKCHVIVGDARIESRAVVIATGYAAHELLKFKPGNLQCTYAVASSARATVPGWPNECLLWETARPYFYGRRTGDGRTIIGGADTSYADDHQRDGLLERKVAQLHNRFRKLFPRAEFVPEYAWAGAFAETEDGLACIGRAPGKSHTYAALGYGGNGITFGIIAARLIVDLFVGRPNPDEQVFSFDR
jgi:glycine/D-amino acid oxidase-like deaminating enzyme